MNAKDKVRAILNEAAVNPENVDTVLFRDAESYESFKKEAKESGNAAIVCALMASAVVAAAAVFLHQHGQELIIPSAAGVAIFVTTATSAGAGIAASAIKASEAIIGNKSADLLLAKINNEFDETVAQQGFSPS